MGGTAEDPLLYLAVAAPCSCSGDCRGKDASQELPRADSDEGCLDAPCSEAPAPPPDEASAMPAASHAPELGGQEPILAAEEP
jgi:hypothetical protein